MLRIDINGSESKFTGTFFCSDKSNGKAIIVLGGSYGGVKTTETIAGILSEKGYMVLTVGYFKIQGMSKSINMIPLEYIENAILWLKNYHNDAVKSIGIYGWSKGAEFALLAATKFPDINCVVALTPASCVYEGETIMKTASGKASWSYGGKSLPYVSLKGCKGWKLIKRMLKEKKFKINYPYEMALERDFDEKATIQVENINGNILMLSVSNDEIWVSKSACERMTHRLKEKDFKYKYKHINYDNGSHILVPISIKKFPIAKMSSMERKHSKQCEKARNIALEDTLLWLEKWNIE